MTKFSVYIGIDWANDKHDVCVQVANSSARKFEVINRSITDALMPEFRD